MKKNRKDTWAGKSNITKPPRSNFKRDNYNKHFKPVKNYFSFFFLQKQKKSFQSQYLQLNIGKTNLLNQTQRRTSQQTKPRTFKSTMRCHIQSDCPQNCKNKGGKKKIVYTFSQSLVYQVCLYLYAICSPIVHAKKMSTVLAGLNCIQASQDTSRDQRDNATSTEQTPHVTFICRHFFSTTLLPNFLKCAQVISLTDYLIGSVCTPA